MISAAPWPTFGRRTDYHSHDEESRLQAHFAGAVESASGWEPVHAPGHGDRFLMMEVLGVSYIAICKAAILSAILYYVAIFSSWILKR